MITIKNKKQSMIIVGAFILVLVLFTTTYAFFNYTRTGSSNNIRVGRISFISKNEETITLNNLFPIDPSNTSDMNDNTKVGTYSIDIKGDTDYVDGIEYLVSAVDANIYTSEGQIVPISLDVTVTDLGDSSANYFTAREDKNANIYKKLVGGTLVGDQMLLVGYIKPNTQSGTAEGVDGNITIKAYLDKNKILISDTYDGTESDNMGTTNSQAEGKTVITTTEWNALQTSGISFKVKVEANEGIWVNPSLEEIMRKNNTGIDTEQGVDFSKTSDQDGLNNDGTRGVYMRAGTQNDAYPILYYRGDVDDNNVIFGDFCWKAVRTTDTGGVKLIYNGELSNTYIPGEKIDREDYINIESFTDFTYNSTDNTWSVMVPSKSHRIIFSVPTGNNYSLVLGGHTHSGGGVYYIYKNGELISSDSTVYNNPISYSYSFGTLYDTDIIMVEYSGTSSNTDQTIVKVKMEQNGSELNEEDYTIGTHNFVFNSTTKKWSSAIRHNEEAFMIFSVEEPGDYFISYTFPSDYASYGIKVNDTLITTRIGTNDIKLSNLQSSDRIEVYYRKGNGHDDDIVEFDISNLKYYGLGCDNTLDLSNISLSENGTTVNNFNWNDNDNSFAYVGYMYGLVYETIHTTANISNLKFGTGFTYSNGIYTLTNAQTGFANTRHYTCFTTSNVCDGDNIGKIYYVYSNRYRTSHIIIENGKSIEDAINEMQANIHDSTAKNKIDAWYERNLNNYTYRLEDTIYCNDRSVSKQLNDEYNGSLGFSFNTTARIVSHEVDIGCTNKNDAFTVYNNVGNRKLTYPIGLLTSDEAVLSGSAFSSNMRITSYINSYSDYFLLSPGIIYDEPSVQLGVTNNGGTYLYMLNSPSGIRPVISIKPGQPIVSGDGTVTDPYVIE